MTSPRATRAATADATLRCADPADRAAVAAVSAAAYAVYRTTLGFTPRPATEDYAPRIARGEVWLAEQDGAPVAVAVLLAGDDHLLVYSLAVDPAHQGMGLGRRLLAHADAVAASRGLAALRLYTNARMARNLALYAADGFRETGRRPHPSRPGLALVDMARPVRPIPG